MRVTATEFRRTLFSSLERALGGQTVEVVYKGVTVRLVPTRPASKLARARRQHALRCDPGSIVESDSQLLGEMQAEWRKDWGEM